MTHADQTGASRSLPTTLRCLRSSARARRLERRSVCHEELPKNAPPLLRGGVFRLLRPRVLHGIGARGGGYIIALALSASLLTLACKSNEDVRSAADARATESAAEYHGTTPEERALLHEVGSLPSGRPTKVDSLTVTAEEPYDAASGRVCRQVSIKGGENPGVRLACKQEDDWFFTADVTGSNAAIGPVAPTDPEVPRAQSVSPSSAAEGPAP